MFTLSQSQALFTHRDPAMLPQSRPIITPAFLFLHWANQQRYNATPLCGFREHAVVPEPKLAWCVTQQCCVRAGLVLAPRWLPVATHPTKWQKKMPLCVLFEPQHLEVGTYGWRRAPERVCSFTVHHTSAVERKLKYGPAVSHESSARASEQLGKLTTKCTNKICILFKFTDTLVPDVP